MASDVRLFADLEQVGWLPLVIPPDATYTLEDGTVIENHGPGTIYFDPSTQMISGPLSDALGVTSASITHPVREETADGN